MPALLSSSSQSGENKTHNQPRGFWDDVADWWKNHGGFPGGFPGSGGNGGNGGGKGSTKPTTPPKTTPKPTSKPTSTPKPPPAETPKPTTKDPKPAPTSDRNNSSKPAAQNPEPKPTSNLVDPGQTPPGQPNQTSTPDSPTPPVNTGALGLNQPSSTADPLQSQGVDDPLNVPARGRFNIAAVLVPVIVLVLAFSAIIFAIFWKRRRRRRSNQPISLHSNETSSYSIVSPPSITGATAGDASARTSVAAGGLILPPRGGTRQVNMDEIQESRPVSLSSSAFDLTNPFANRGGTTIASSGWGSEAGHSSANLAAPGPSPLHNAAFSTGHSIVGSGDFSTASAHDGHGNRSLAPTPGVEYATSPFGNDARISGGPNVSHTRLVYPSVDDIVSEDGHVGQYGAAIASSVGHGLHADDGRSTFSGYAQSGPTPTSLFFRLSQDMRNSLTLVTESAPPLPAKPAHLLSPGPVSPTTPTPNSADPFLPERDTPSPVWMNLRAAAPSPPPSGPLPSLPGQGAFGRGPPSPLNNRNSVYGGIEESDMGSQSTIVQHASRAPMQTPVFMSAPPAGRKASSPSASSFGAPLQRSPSVLTSGSDDF